MKIAVTGIGLVTAMGDDFWDCVSKGINKGVEVTGFKRGPSRFMDLALSAAEKSVSDAGLSKELLRNTGVTLSTSKGSVLNGDIACNGLMPNVIGQEFGCFGPVLNVISACATGLNSIIIGCNIIRSGRAKTVIAGGVDSCLNEFTISAFSKLGVLSKDGVCRPYSRNRSGFVLGEGAGVVILEDLEQAKERDADIYGCISGWSTLSDAYHMTSLDPSGEAAAKAIELCLKRSGTHIEEVDYINTHGTGTLQNDLAETKGLKRVFGSKAYDLVLSSTKAVTGHLLGASGVVEFVIGLLAMRNSFVPPTVNLTDPDPLCDLNYTPNTGREYNIENFLTLSYGFGGHVACVKGGRT